MDISKGHFKYKKSTYNPLVRKKQFDIVDFLSFLGGTMGLLMGFSVLSFFEMIYWLGIRTLMKILKRSSKIQPNVTIVSEVNLVTEINPESEANLEDEIDSQSDENMNKKCGIVIEFFKSTSIHGVKNFVEGKLFDK